MTVSLHFTKKITLRKPTIVLGFPGVGLVGSIVATYLTKDNSFELVGYVMGDEFAPLAAIHNYTPLPPVRIYYSKKHNMMLFLSEIVIPLSSASEMAEKILELCDKVKATNVLVLGGLTRKTAKSESIYVVGTDKKKLQEIVKKGSAKTIKEGATSGVAGYILGLASMRSLNTLALLVEANPDFADPSAALKLLKCFSSITNIDVDSSELEKEAKKMEKMEKKTLSTTTFQKPLGPMYG